MMGLGPCSSASSQLVRWASLVVLVCCGLALLLLPGLAHAQTFPKLTGPVVDAANVIPDDQEARLTQKLIALKQQSNRELQVVTLADLQGYEIADYGYQLGRHWGLGAKDKNDGAILIVAPAERRLRIEVGYGLEATLTDGLSSLIIGNIITPKFKAGDLPGGIEAGTDAIIKQLLLPPEEALKVAAQAQAQAAQSARQRGGNPLGFVLIPLLIFLVVLPMLRRRRGGRAYGGSGLGPIILWNVLEGMSRGGGGLGGGGGGFGGGGGGGSSWGGGGGSFGGGGSSGSW